MSEHPATDEMTFSHFSEKPVTTVYPMRQLWRDGGPSCYDKPCGFWVSVDGPDDWPSWAAAESFGIGGIRHRVFIDMERVLLIPTALDLAAFDERYGVNYFRYGHEDRYLDWQRVANDYAGIVIAPYCWKHRLDMRWYYGWDCASGCIWDSTAIVAVEAKREAA